MDTVQYNQLLKVQQEAAAVLREQKVNTVLDSMKMVDERKDVCNNL